MTKRTRITLAALLFAGLATAATITSLTVALPDIGPIFTIADQAVITGNNTITNTNFSNINAVIGSATATPTGTGPVVLQTSPTLITPVLGTPTSVALTNATSFPPSLVHLNVQKTLALGDLQALNSVPYAVIAAPGATSMIQMGSCTLNLTRGSAAFTGGGTVSIGYDTTSSPATNGTIASTVFTTFAASHAVVVLPVAVAVTATTSLANKGIYLTAAAADFASGTGASGQLNCDYSVVTGVQ